MFKKYTPDDYDKHGYLKPPVGLNLLLLLLMRAYVVWVLSVANRADGTALIASLYPNKYDFFIGLGVGLGALVVMVLLSLRRERAPRFAAKIWTKGKWFLWGSWCLDVLLTCYVIKQHKFAFEPQMALVMVALFFAGWYLYKSERLTDVFNNWPSDSYEQVEDEQKGAH